MGKATVQGSRNDFKAGEVCAAITRMSQKTENGAGPRAGPRSGSTLVAESAEVERFYLRTRKNPLAAASAGANLLPPKGAADGFDPLFHGAFLFELWLAF
jgi:hypothetical protein